MFACLFALLPCCSLAALPTSIHLIGAAHVVVLHAGWPWSHQQQRYCCSVHHSQPCPLITKHALVPMPLALCLLKEPARCQAPLIQAAVQLLAAKTALMMPASFQTALVMPWAVTAQAAVSLATQLHHHWQSSSVQLLILLVDPFIRAILSPLTNLCFI